MTRKLESTTSVRSSISNMKIGEILSFPKSRTNVIKTTASMLGWELDRIYKTKINRSASSIEVIRVQ